MNVLRSALQQSRLELPAIRAPKGNEFRQAPVQSSMPGCTSVQCSPLLAAVSMHGNLIAGMLMLLTQQAALRRGCSAILLSKHSYRPREWAPESLLWLSQVRGASGYPQPSFGLVC